MNADVNSMSSHNVIKMVDAKHMNFSKNVATNQMLLQFKKFFRKLKIAATTKSDS